MNLREFPLVTAVLDAGPANRVYDALLLAGLPLLALAVVAETVLALDAATVVVQALAVAYIATFVVYVLYRGTQ